MENGEDFWLRYYNGSSWSTVATWARGTSFQNGNFYVATVTLEDTNSYNSLFIEGGIGKVIEIPVGTVHRLQNKGKEDLILIETQTGSYFGEDDIVRLDDDYGRNK